MTAGSDETVTTGGNRSEAVSALERTVLAPLAEVARSLTSAVVFSDVMQRVADGALRLTRARGAYVEQIATAADTVEVLAGVGDGVPAPGTRVPYPGSLTDEILDDRSARVFAEVGAIGPAAAPYLAESCRGCSVLIVPLIAENEILGTLVLLGDGRDHFGDTEVMRARILGDLASVSLRRVLMLAEAEERRHELEVSEQRFRLIVESVRDYAIFMMDPTGRIVTWTSGAERIHQYRGEEILGRSFTVLYPEEDVEEGVPQEVLELAQRHGTWADRGWRVRKDGSRFWAHVTITVMRSASGEFIGFSEVSRDLTAYMIAETAVRDSEQRFRALAENATEAIVTLDIDDQIHFANPAAARIFGYRTEDLLLMPFTSLIPERLRPRHVEGLRRFAATRQRRIAWDGIELPGLRSDGSEVALEVTFSCFEERGHLYFSGIMRDITTRKEAEAERERLLRGEQTAREEAEQAVKARENVLGIVSHDLRNPLNTILLSAGFLCETIEGQSDPAAVRKQLDIVERSAKRMNRMIEDLLDISRIEAGRLSVNATPLSAQSLAREACELIRPLAETKEIAFACELGEPLPRVLADRDRIHQVIGNLAGNAVKFTPEGGRIALRVALLDGHVEFALQDTGPGIPQDQLPRLFQAHWQARSTAHLGSGLGLAIARGIVEAHGGRIWVQTAPGQGSTFRFTVPVFLQS